MDEQQLINMFANGTWNQVALRGKTFKVEILSGFLGLGFSGYWTKRFWQSKNKGHNKLCSVIFGQFRVVAGLWSGYECVMLDYGPGFVFVKDYMRQVGDNTWLGVYEVDGHAKGWFRLTEVIK